MLAVVLALFIISLSGNSFAQEEKKVPKPGWVVSSENIVKSGKMATVNKMIDTAFAPVMKELMDEGILIGWGQLNHAWGDEWNLNIYYINKDHEAFVKFWKEFLKRVKEKFPQVVKEMSSLLSRHKDNMYYVRHMHSLK